jgi:hypothetical protein
VVWGGCGECLGDRGPQHLGVDRAIGEPAHRTAHQQGLPPAEFDCFCGAEPEQILWPAAQQSGRARSVVGQRQPA